MISQSSSASQDLLFTQWCLSPLSRLCWYTFKYTLRNSLCQGKDREQFSLPCCHLCCLPTQQQTQRFPEVPLKLSYLMNPFLLLSTSFARFSSRWDLFLPKQCFHIHAAYLCFPLLIECSLFAFHFSEETLYLGNWPSEGVPSLFLELNSFFSRS